MRTISMNNDDFNEGLHDAHNHFDLLSNPETLEILSYLGESRGLEADEMLDEMISDGDEDTILDIIEQRFEIPDEIELLEENDSDDAVQEEIDNDYYQ